MRRLGTRIEEHENFILCYVGSTPGKYGVGFVINYMHKDNIESFTGISERVAVLNMNIQGYMITIIQVYAPTEAASESDMDEFYKTVDRALEDTHETVILMGDFNAKIGVPQKEEHLIMKRFGYGKRNKRGQRLVDFALQHRLMIINTCFNKKQNRRWTWRSPSGVYKNEIDFILSNQPRLFQDIGTMNLNYPSDHRLIRAKLNLTDYKKSRAKFTNTQANQLKNEEEILNYMANLSILLAPSSTLQENTKVQDYYDSITNAITSSLKKAKLTEDAQKRHKILSARTAALLQRRKELQRTKQKTRAMKNELAAFYKLVNKYIKNDYARYRQNIIEKYLNLTGSTKRAHKDLRTNTTWIEGLKKADQDVNKRIDIITTATDFYRELYSIKTQEPTTQINTTRHSSEENIQLIDETEVIEAIKRLKVEKSPGSDNITNEALKTAQVILATPLAELFNLILQKSETPKQWSESNIILIYKKGDPKNVGNYRPISLLPSLYKLFSAIINARISPEIEDRQPVEQAGFRKGFSTLDHIHTLELVIEKYQEQQRPLYLAFIDYQKAFDTVTHASIWESLKEQGVHEVYIDVIKSIYKNNMGRIKLESLGPSFPIRRGVRQGDPLSPKIFIAILEVIINKLNWSKMGIYVDCAFLSHLRFADDIVILSDTSSQLQNMIESLQIASTNVGLEINLTKTMTMTNSVKIPIRVNGKPLEYTEHYIYLGKTISFDRKTNEIEIDRRVQQTWKKYWSLKEFFKSNLPISLKTKIMNSSLIPCLTYGCQTWKFTAKAKHKITTCQRGMERSMLKVRKTDKIRHTKIRGITKSKNALTYAQKLKWKWAGHLARLSDQRWTLRATLWKGPQGKRSRGRPVTRWEDEITKTAGSNWSQIAKDRDTWTALEEAFTQSGVLAKEDN